MKDLINAQKMIYPDLLEVMQKRFTILYTISLFEPIGRRGIVEQTGFTERFIRNEIDLLQNQNLVQMTTKGMLITEIGKDIITNLHEFNRELSGIRSEEHTSELQSRGHLVCRLRLYKKINDKRKL